MLNKKFSMLPSKLPPHVTALDAFYGRGTAKTVSARCSGAAKKIC